MEWKAKWKEKVPIHVIMFLVLLHEKEKLADEMDWLHIYLHIFQFLLLLWYFLCQWYQHSHHHHYLDKNLGITNTTYFSPVLCTISQKTSSHKTNTNHHIWKKTVDVDKVGKIIFYWSVSPSSKKWNTYINAYTSKYFGGSMFAFYSVGKMFKYVM